MFAARSVISVCTRHPLHLTGGLGGFAAMLKRIGMILTSFFADPLHSAARSVGGAAKLMAVIALIVIEVSLITAGVTYIWSYWAGKRAPVIVPPVLHQTIWPFARDTAWPWAQQTWADWRVKEPVLLVERVEVPTVRHGQIPDHFIVRDGKLVFEVTPDATPEEVEAYTRGLTLFLISNNRMEKQE